MANNTKAQRRALADEYITRRAKDAAFNMPLPQSVNELAGMLAGFAQGVHRDVTPMFLRGYADAKRRGTLAR